MQPCFRVPGLLFIHFRLICQIIILYRSLVQWLLNTVSVWWWPSPCYWYYSAITPFLLLRIILYPLGLSVSRQIHRSFPLSDWVMVKRFKTVHAIPTSSLSLLFNNLGLNFDWIFTCGPGWMFLSLVQQSSSNLERHNPILSTGGGCDENKRYG